MTHWRQPKLFEMQYKCEMYQLGACDRGKECMFRHDKTPGGSISNSSSSSSSSKKRQLPGVSKRDVPHVWEWKNDSGWEAYPAEVSEQIERAFAADRGYATLTRGFFATHNGYTVKFDIMMQRNLAKSTRRQVRRVPAKAPGGKDSDGGGGGEASSSSSSSKRRKLEVDSDAAGGSKGDASPTKQASSNVSGTSKQMYDSRSDGGVSSRTRSSGNISDGEDEDHDADEPNSDEEKLASEGMLALYDPADARPAADVGGSSPNPRPSGLHGFKDIRFNITPNHKLIVCEGDIGSFRPPSAKPSSSSNSDGSSNASSGGIGGGTSSTSSSSSSSSNSIISRSSTGSNSSSGGSNANTTTASSSSSSSSTTSSSSSKVAPNAFAVVNAANAGLWAGSGVCGAIFRAAGHQALKAACIKARNAHVNRKGKKPRCGDAIETPAYRMQLNGGPSIIVHAIAPNLNSGEDIRRLGNAYFNSLAQVEGKVSAIVFPSLGTGVFGCDIKSSSQLFLKALRMYFQKNKESSIRRVFMVLFNPHNATEVKKYRNAYVQAAQTYLESFKAFYAKGKES